MKEQECGTCPSIAKKFDVRVLHCRRADRDWLRDLFAGRLHRRIARRIIGPRALDRDRLIRWPRTGNRRFRLSSRARMWRRRRGFLIRWSSPAAVIEGRGGS